MKRIAAMLLAALLLFQAAALAEGTPDEEPARPFVAANPTPMRGEFFTELWGNDTADDDVKELLHGYDLVMWNGEAGMFTADPSVVEGIAVTQNAAGDRSYTLQIFDDLFYCDGTRITAWDYAFSYLLTLSPEIAKIGGTPLRREQILGYAGYLAGDVPYLAGVRVVNDTTLAVTLDHNYLPFFYEMGLLMCRPYPISVIAPGVTVRDDGSGVYLANIDPAVTEPVFSAELLRATILDPETGYLSHPSVTSGPYRLLSWDGVTAEFEINPYYKGNAYGEVPTITPLVFTLAENDTMVEKLVSGEFQLINKMTRADSITASMLQMSEAGLAWQNYPRIGLSYISFACERPTVSSEAVRQAIAWCMDRDAIVSDYTGAFGLRVDGFYGVGQWMYGLIAGTSAYPVQPPEDANDAAANAAYEARLAAFERLNLDGLTPYTVDEERAAELLAADGWTRNGDGILEKDGVVLDLKLIYPVGNNVFESLQTNLAEHLEHVGIRLTMEAVPMAELLTRWYKQGERDEDMIYLATNFDDMVYDPSVHFQTLEAENEAHAADTHGWSYTNLSDEKLYGEAVAMRKTEPGDVLSYMEHWIAFQERFNEILPMIPVYSNIYFDFYTDALQNYRVDQRVTWSQAIVGARLGEPAEAGEAGEEAEPAEGEAALGD